MKQKMLAVLALAAAVATGFQSGNALPIGRAEASMAWSPGVPSAGRDVTFSISASDPAGLVTSVRLEYGDGASDAIVVPRSLLRDTTACLTGDAFNGTLRHRFASPAEYKARLIVTSGSCPVTDAVTSRTTVVSYTITVITSAL